RQDRRPAGRWSICRPRSLPSRRAIDPAPARNSPREGPMGCLFDTEKRRRQTAKLPSSAVLPVMKKAAGSARRARYPVLRTSLVPPAPRRLDQLQERHRRGISPARPKFEQPGVTTVAVTVAGSHFFKELAHRFGII